MKTKERKNLAKRIAKCEAIIANSKDKQEIKMAKEEILKLTKKITSLEDIFEIDIYIQEYLESNLI